MARNFFRACKILPSEPAAFNGAFTNIHAIFISLNGD